MPITHTNAKGKTYYLHQGTTKTGKPKYHFSMQSEGTLAESIPAGFEIYENPNARSSSARFLPRLLPMRNARSWKTACASMRGPGLQD